MQGAQYSGLAFALAICGWFAFGIGCQFPTIRPRPTATPIDMRGDEPDFPANVLQAIPAGTSVDDAHATLQSSGFTVTASTDEEGLHVFHARRDQPLEPRAGAVSASLVSKNYFVTIYHDGQVVKRIETKLGATGP